MGFELIFPKAVTTFLNGITRKREEIKNKNLEGKQLPKGSVVKQTVYPGGFEGSIAGPSSKPQGQASFTRTIKYGISPEQNDTSYTRSNITDVGIVDPEIGFNEYYYKK